MRCPLITARVRQPGPYQLGRPGQQWLWRGLLVQELRAARAATVDRLRPPAHVGDSSCRHGNRLRDRSQRLTCRLIREPLVFVVRLLPVRGEVDGGQQTDEKRAAVERDNRQAGNCDALAELS